MRRAGLRWSVLISVGLHGLLAALLLVRLGADPPLPTQWAKVELIQQDTPTVGDGAPDSGQGQNQASATAPPPAPMPTPPTMADLPPVPMPADVVPPAPAPMPPPRPDVAATSLPPPQSPASPPQPQARATPPAPHSPPPSPNTELPAGPPADAPAIRLGEGGTIGTALVSGDNIIPAAPDSKIRNPQPPYPAESARRGEEGTVILVVHVAPDGSALGVEVQETSGYERLDKSARDAVTRWHFRPAQQYGGPIASDMPVRVRFVLKE